MPRAQKETLRALTAEEERALRRIAGLPTSPRVDEQVVSAHR